MVLRSQSSEFIRAYQQHIEESFVAYAPCRVMRSAPEPATHASMACRAMCSPPPSGKASINRPPSVRTGNSPRGR